MHIYLLAGYIGSGKSFAASCLHTLLQRSRMTAFANKIKDAVAKQYNLPRELCDTQEGKATTIQQYNTTVRNLLIRHSAELKAIYGVTVFADAVVEEIQSSPEILVWILHDWRYVAEYNALIKAFPEAEIHTIRITRLSVSPIDDPSEHELDYITMDHVICNDGTETDIKEKLKYILPYG